MRTMSVCVLMIATLLSAVRSLRAVELTGEVTAVRNSAIDLRVTSDLYPAIGDLLSVFVEIPGIGRATVASGTVTGVEGAVIRAKIEEASGKIRVGQAVVIQSPHPVKRPPATVPVLIGRTAAAAKQAAESAGFQPEIQVGVDAPARVTPFTVYEQDPAPGNELAAGGKIVITLYGGESPAPALPEANVPPPIPDVPTNAIASADPRDNHFPPWPTLKVGQAWLGVSDIVHEGRTSLLGVLQDGPAGKAGLQANDIIVAVNGHPLGTDWNSLRVRINTFGAGETVSLEIERDGAKQTVDVTLEQIPPDGGIGRLTAAADAGEAWAMAELGVRYMGGYRDWSYVEKDLKKGREWVRTANDADSAIGAYRLAATYLSYRDFEKDESEAARLLERARSLSVSADYSAIYFYATERLARLYRTGESLPRNYERAMTLYRELSDHGLASAGYYLGEMYKLGEGVPKDDTQAMRWYHQGALAGDKYAQTEMGMIAYEGRGSVTRNYDTAVGWFRLAVKNGSAFGMLYLGECYQYGRGVPKDLKAAARLYEQAANRAFSGGTIGLAWRLAGQLYESHGAELGYNAADAREAAIVRYRKAAKWNEDARQALQRLGVPAGDD